MSWYDLFDFFHPSAVEKARRTYAAVIYDTEDAVESLRQELAAVNDDLNRIISCFRGEDVVDVSTGQVVEDFEAAVEKCRLESNVLVGPFGLLTVAVNDLDGKLGSVDMPGSLRSRKSILDGMYVREDQLEHEYSDSDIPF